MTHLRLWARRHRSVGWYCDRAAALFDDRESRSAAIQDEYANGLSVAQALNDGISTRDEITDAWIEIDRGGGASSSLRVRPIGTACAPV